MNEKVNTATEVSRGEQTKKHTKKRHHRSSRHRHSSRHYRRKQNGFIWYKIKHFFRKNGRQRKARLKNPNHFEQKVMLFWIFGVVFLMVVLIPLVIFLADNIFMNQNAL